MPGLTRRNRSLCAIAGAVCAVAAFALIPPSARSAAYASARDGRPEIAREAEALLRDAAVALPPLDDPFARTLPAEPRAPRAGTTASRDTGSRRSGAPDRLTLRALVSGRDPYALVDLGSATQIVGVGDRIGRVRVRRIDADAIVLDDGRRLSLEAAHE